MWTSRSEELIKDRELKYFIKLDTKPATFSEVIRGWQSDTTFRTMFNDLLADAPFSAFRWETPPVTIASTTQTFEFVLLNNPTLARRSNPTAFAEHLSTPSETGVVEFPNLGRDAIMIVPCIKTTMSAYGHLAAFARQAPEAQRHAFWQLVGQAMTRRLNTKPVWLSTAGGGVSWLHVRLDDRPKYYGFGPYRQVT